MNYYNALFFLAYATVALGQQKDFNLTGNTEYSQQGSSSLHSYIESNYRTTLFEPKHKKWCYILSGKIFADYDHFGNEIKINVFTTFGVDF